MLLLKRRRAFRIGRIFSMTLVISLLAGCSQEKEPVMDTTITVETTAAAEGDLALDETFVATISTENSASVYPKVSGTVTNVYVSEGDTVQEGDVLCTFEDANSVGISAAQAQLSYSELVRTKYPKAEVSGVLSEVYVHNGDSISVGAPIAKIVQNDDIVVDFLFTYASPSNFYIGQTATVFINGFAGSVQGTVTAVPDSTTVTSDGKSACSVRVKINNPGVLTDSGSYTASAVIGSYTSYGNAPMSISGANTVYAEASGTIQGLNKVAGSTVDAGERLCSIDSDTLDAQIRQASLSAQSAGNAVDNFTVTAPISGVVEAVNVTANNMAASGSPAFVISPSGARTATFYVTDAVAKSMEMGQPTAVTYQGTDYSGTITEIGLAVDATTGLFKIEATLEGAIGLANGTTVSLSTAAQMTHDTLIIPADALYFDEGNGYVYVMRDGTAVRTDVTVSIYGTDEVSITSGLSAGDEVITSWSASLKDGAAVRLASESAVQEVPQDEADA